MPVNRIRRGQFLLPTTGLKDREILGVNPEWKVFLQKEVNFYSVYLRGPPPPLALDTVMVIVFEAEPP